MTIKSVVVKKSKNKIFYYPWWGVVSLTKHVKSLNLITIGDKYSDIYKEVPCNKRLILNTIIIPSDMTEDNFITVNQFVKELNGESLVVHCEGGLSRSPWLVRYIMNNFPEYEFEEFVKVIQLA